MLPESLRTLSNSSSTNALAWTDNGTAIVVPAHTINVSYTAEAIGVQTQCQSITNRCVYCSPSQYTNPDGSVDNDCKTATFSSLAWLNFSCPNLNTTSDISTDAYVDGLIDPATNSAMPLADLESFEGLATSK